MKAFNGAILLACFLLLALAAPRALAASGYPLTWMNFYEAPDIVLGAPPGTLIRYERVKAPPFFRAKLWRMLYVTSDYLGRPILSSGLVVLPDYAPKDAAQRQVVAWHPPTQQERHPSTRHRYR